MPSKQYLYFYQLEKASVNGCSSPRQSPYLVWLTFSASNPTLVMKPKAWLKSLNAYSLYIASLPPVPTTPRVLSPEERGSVSTHDPNAFIWAVRVDASRVATPRRPNVDKESLEMDVRPRMQYILKLLWFGKKDPFLFQQWPRFFCRQYHRLPSHHILE